MIDISAVLQSVPRFKRFASVMELHALVDTLRADEGFEIEMAGASEAGAPIHHVRFGEGAVKALIVGFPHPNEPIGGLTVTSLLSLLKERHRALIGADVEWHIVPCIDPDGAALNEGWSQNAFSLESYMRSYHRQEPRDQVECSFPIRYKNLVFDQPTPEAKVLQGLLEKIRPDFYYSLHNDYTGGAYFCLSRAIDPKYCRQLHELLEAHDVPLQTQPPYVEWLPEYAPGITQIFSMKTFYDFIEKTLPEPQRVMQSGGCSWDFLAEIKPDALTLLGEYVYVKHPSDGSQRQTGQNMRQARLRADADAKFIVTVILEEWENVKDEVNPSSPFYRKVVGGMIKQKDMLHEGLPSWPFKTRDLLFNPGYSRTMTEGERFNVQRLRFGLLCHGYEFVRLLKDSRPTPALTLAIERLDPLFDEACSEIAKNIHAEAFENIDYDTLAKVQLGSGLIVLNSVLEKRSI